MEGLAWTAEDRRAQEKMQGQKHQRDREEEPEPGGKVKGSLSRVEAQE